MSIDKNLVKGSTLTLLKTGHVHLIRLTSTFPCDDLSHTQAKLRASTKLTVVDQFLFLDGAELRFGA